MPSSRVHSAEGIVLVCAVLLGGACRSYDPNLRELDAAVDGAAAGDACQATDCAVPAMCSVPDGSTARLFDCDESALTVCETDVSYHPYHCGGCDRPCADLCQESQCRPIERLLENVAYDTSPIYKRHYLHAIGDRHVYAMVLSDALERRSLVRVSRTNGEVETVLANVDQDIDQLAMGAERLYVLSGTDLKSLALSGAATLRLEATHVRAMAADGERLVYWDSDEHVHAKNTLTGVAEDLGEIASVAMLSVRGSTLAVLVQRTLARSHDVWARTADERPLQKLVERPVLGELIKAYEGDVLVLENDGEVYPVVRYSVDAVREVARYELNKQVSDFVVDETHLYVDFNENTSSGIEVLALKNPSYRAVSGVKAPLNGLLLDGSDLYLMQGLPASLVHVRTDTLRF